MTKIFLIGLPGSGKTTLGKQLAEKLKIAFVDLDVEIEKQEGKTVQEIFAEKSEKHFRELEAKKLESLCQEKINFVMATGGGTPSFFDNMALMNQSGKTIFLDEPTSEISSRLLKTDLTTRPLFAQLNPEQVLAKINTLRSQRIDFYIRSRIVISGNVTLEKILEDLKD